MENSLSSSASNSYGQRPGGSASDVTLIAKWGAKGRIASQLARQLGRQDRVAASELDQAARCQKPTAYGRPTVGAVWTVEAAS